MRERREKELGILGEHYFERLCIGSEINKSRPGRDDKGWDFFVELPQNRLTHVLLDSQPSPIKALCQVKATDDFSKYALSMKVSNFEHLARTPLPAFVLVFEFKGKDTPQAAYLCPFGPDRVGATLKRIRELQACGKLTLHKHTMLLQAAPHEEIDLSDRSTLIKSILDHTGHDAGAYAQRKSSWLRDLGFGPDSYRFKFNSSVSISDFVDVMLGLKDGFEIENASFSSTRFDIEVEERQFQSGRLSISPVPDGNCKIVASSTKTAKRSEIDADVYTPSIPGLEREFFKVRIRNEFIDAVLSPGDCKFKFNTDPEKSYEISALASNLRFLSTATQKGARISFFRNGRKFGSTVSLSVLGPSPYYHDLTLLADILEQAIRLANVDGPALIAPKNLLKQTESLQYAQLLVSPQKQTVSNRIEPQGPIKPRTTKGIFATFIPIELEDCDLYIFAHWQARLTLEQEKITATMRQGEVWGSAKLPKDSTEGLAEMEAEFQQFCREIGRGNLMIRYMNLDPSEGEKAARLET